VGLFAPIGSYVETLVHPTAQGDVLAAARHRAFIAPRLLGSIIALASFPVYLLIRGTPGLVELLVFVWLIAPILIAYFLSRTGRYESAHVLSSLALAGLVTAVAAATGGLASFATIWLIIVPFEAALSASRRVVAIATISALCAAGLLVLLGRYQLVPQPSPGVPPAFGALGIVSAALYAAALALSAEALARTSVWLLSAEEDRYRLLARNITDVITRHGRDGAVLFASPAAEALLGARVTELYGHGLFERIHVADRPAYLTAIGDAAALGETSSVEFRARRDVADANGRSAVEYIWIEMCCRPLKLANAEPGVAEGGEVVAVLRHVTERKRRQQALLEAHAQAERANAAKGRFLATMSHELRTPLSAIIGFSDMLVKEDELMLDAKRRCDYAAVINESGRHLLSVVNSILDMSRIETDNFEITPEPFAPAQAITSCCKLLTLRASEAGVRLEQIVPADLPTISADKRAFNQILINLLSNAIRFSDRGGIVRVSARAEAAAVTFMVEDNGIGINEADLACIGEPYFQAAAGYERRHGGTGLGLSIVKGLVRLHGGNLAIRSRLGEGTRVTVRLPLNCEQTRRPKRFAAHAGGRVVSYLPNTAMTAAPNPASGRDAVGYCNDVAVKKSA
jgi:cell cycle sensor histidine kinase DivJ